MESVHSRGVERFPPIHFFEKLKKIPNNFCNVVESTERTAEEQCVSEHPELFQGSYNWLCERAILAPKNNSVNALNLEMSINKAQGQSLKVAGIHLETPDFSHGQLYVACARVGTEKNLYIFAPDGKTRNIVYQTALQ